MSGRCWRHLAIAATIVIGSMSQASVGQAQPGSAPGQSGVSLAEVIQAQSDQPRVERDRPSEETPTEKAAEGDAGPHPRLEVEIDIEIQNDYAFESDDPDGEFNNLFTTTEPAVGFYILPGLSIQSGLVIEEITNTQPGEDRVFDEHGIFVEQLFLLYENPYFSAYGGKFNPPFGIAWDVAPGVFGTEQAEEFYEQVEKIGFGGAVNFGGEGIGGEGFGEHSLSAQTFFADTTILSDAFGTERGPLRLRDGGPSNTEDLSSFTVTLDGSFPEVFAEPGYHLGVLRQESGRGDPEDEVAVAAALTASVPLGEELAVEPLVEYVHFFDAEGQDQERDILTGGLGVTYGPWNLALAHTSVFTDVNDPMLEDNDVHQSQVSVGHSFGFGLDVDLGYKFVQENDIDSHVFGVLLHYNFGFQVPG